MWDYKIRMLTKTGSMRFELRRKQNSSNKRGSQKFEHWRKRALHDLNINKNCQSRIWTSENTGSTSIELQRNLTLQILYVEDNRFYKYCWTWKKISSEKFGSRSKLAQHEMIIEETNCSLFQHWTKMDIKDLKTEGNCLCKLSTTNNIDSRRLNIKRKWLYNIWRLKNTCTSCT